MRVKGIWGLVGSEFGRFRISKGVWSLMGLGFQRCSFRMFRGFTGLGGLGPRAVYSLESRGCSRSESNGLEGPLEGTI